MFDEKPVEAGVSLERTFPLERFGGMKIGTWISKKFTDEDEANTWKLLAYRKLNQQINEERQKHAEGL